MWYIQINNNAPQKFIGTECKAQNVKQRTKWQFDIAHPSELDILYIFNEYSAIKHAYTIKVTVGSLPDFYLGCIDNNTPFLQSEPNFPIQPNVKCYVTMEQKMENEFKSTKKKIMIPSSSNQILSAPNPKNNEMDKNRIKQLKQCAAVSSFNDKFYSFMDTLKWCAYYICIQMIDFKHFMLYSEWSQLFMTEIQRMINRGQLNRNQKVPKDVLYTVVKKLHSHIQSPNVNREFQAAVENMGKQRLSK